MFFHMPFLHFILKQVRGYRMVKEGLKRRIIDIERERRRAQSLGCDRATLVRGPGTDQVIMVASFTLQIIARYLQVKVDNKIFLYFLLKF